MTGAALLLADVPSPPVHLHRLLSAWQVGAWAPDLALGWMVVVGAAYWAGVRRLRRRGRAWSRWRSGAFAAGLLALLVAADSGLASYDDSVFTLHIAQHLLIMMVAPPLLALGAPVTLALQASSRPVQSRLVRLLHNRLVGTATSPYLAAGLYYAAMWADLESAFYPYSLAHPLVHDASHLVMLGLGCLFWWPIIATDELPRRPSAGIRLATLFVGMPIEAFLGVALLMSGSPIAPQHTLADTQTGGAVFWVAAMFITVTAALVIGMQWVRTEERAGERADRRSGPGPSGMWEAEWTRRTGSVPPTREHIGSR